MPPIVQKAKENPLAALITAATAIGTIIGMFLSVDSRYAHSDEIEKLKVEQQQVIRQNRFDLQQSANFIRKQQLDDKVFELELLPLEKRTIYDTARLNKYKSDLEDIKQSLRQASPDAIPGQRLP